MGDDRCTRCDRINAFKTPAWLQLRDVFVAQGFVTARAELRRTGPSDHCYGMEDCIAVDWRARAIELQAELDKRGREANELEAQVERMRPLCEAAEELIRQKSKQPGRSFFEVRALKDAVDAYRDGGTASAPDFEAYRQAFVAEYESANRERLAEVERERDEYKFSFRCAQSEIAHLTNELSRPPVTVGDGGHSCQWCPVDVRNLSAVAHNVIVWWDKRVENPERLVRKIEQLRETLARYQPQIDQHFAAVGPYDFAGQPSTIAPSVERKPCPDCEALRKDYLDVADALLPRSSGPDDLVREARRLRAEVERLEKHEDEALSDAARMLTRCLPYVSVEIGEWRADGDHKMADAIDKLKRSMLAFIEEHGGRDG